jgi:hypothetical protein
MHLPIHFFRGSEECRECDKPLSEDGTNSHSLIKIRDTQLKNSRTESTRSPSNPMFSAEASLLRMLRSSICDICSSQGSDTLATSSSTKSFGKMLLDFERKIS